MMSQFPARKTPGQQVINWMKDGCPNCGRPGNHFIPPTFGESAGRFSCVQRSKKDRDAIKREAKADDRG